MVQVVAGGVLDARGKEKSFANGQLREQVVKLLHKADANGADAVDENVAAVGLARVDRQVAGDAVEEDGFPRIQGNFLKV